MAVFQRSLLVCCLLFSAAIPVKAPLGLLKRSKKSDNQQPKALPFGSFPWRAQFDSSLRYLEGEQARFLNRLSTHLDDILRDLSSHQKEKQPTDDQSATPEVPIYAKPTKHNAKKGEEPPPIPPSLKPPLPEHEDTGILPQPPSVAHTPNSARKGGVKRQISSLAKKQQEEADQKSHKAVAQEAKKNQDAKKSIAHLMSTWKNILQRAF